MSDIGLEELITVDAALAILNAVLVAPPTARQPTGAALGMTLAADVVADRDYPPADKSLMDGYAVRAADTAGGATLRVVGEVAAGALFARPLAPEEAVAIMTGGFVPDGADAVVPVEGVERAADTVRVPATTAGKAVARRASDGAAGRIILRAGQPIGPRQIAAAATVGARELTVFASPRVGVLVTGDEISAGQESAAREAESRAGRPCHEELRTRDCNGPMLVTLLAALGCDVVDLGHAADDLDELRAALARAAGLDVLFVCGGMSMGKYDFVPSLLKEAGYVARISKLKIQPGKPFVFAEHGDENARLPRFVFGLPGNPVSGYVCTVRLAARLLARLGAGGAAERWRALPLAQPLPPGGARETYLPATVDADGRVTRLQSNGSADVFTLAAADVLIKRPESAQPQAAGETVLCLEIL